GRVRVIYGGITPAVQISNFFTHKRKGSSTVITPKLDKIYAFGQFFYFGSVLGEVQVHIPVPIGCGYGGEAQYKLPTSAFNQTGIDQLLAISRRTGHVDTQDLVFIFHLIVGSRETQAVV